MVNMPSPKRVLIFVVRCLTVFVAVGFLAFYVARVRLKQNAVFSSSKNLRALSSGAEQYFLEHMEEYIRPKPKSGGIATPLTPVPQHTLPPAPSLSTASLRTDAGQKFEVMLNSFRFGLFPDQPATFSGSKSMGHPVMNTSDFFRFWTVPPKTTLHTDELPTLAESQRDMISGAPSPQVQPVAAEPGFSPAPKTEPEKK